MAGGLCVEEVSTPIGTVQVAAGPAGVAWVRLPGSSLPPRVVIAGAVGGEGGPDPEALAREGARQVSEYFAGSRTSFDVPVDLEGVTNFQRAVLEAASRIPFGQTAGYREVAIAAGSPGAVRAAGSAMGANPVPILIPCHRVIRSDGTPGLYGGGEDTKRWLLDFEQRVAARGTANKTARSGDPVPGASAGWQAAFGPFS